MIQSRVDIVLLALLRAATHQDHQPIAVFPEIDPVPRSEIDFVFEQPATDALDVRKVTARKPGQARGHFRRRLGIQAVEPVCLRTVSIGRDIFPNVDHLL
jgi:hypothetical protein